ncbi:tetratricopeptide repeat protein [bacterium]|nr:tetratricopeptide repeat protein [candidate division CSSED10-310 bacterium]
MKRFRFIVVSFLLVLMIGCTSSLQKKAPVIPETDPDIDRCYMLVESADYAEALTVCDRAVNRNPDSFIARASYAKALVESGRFAEGIEQYRQSLDLTPDAVQTRMELADAYTRVARYSDAVSEYKAIRTQQPSYLDAAVRLAQVCEETGDFLGAIDALRDAVAIQPGNDALYLDLVDLYKKAGRRSDAQNTLREAAHAFPEVVHVQYAAGVLWQEMKQYREAIDLYRRVQRLAGDYQNTAFNLAVCQYETGDIISAEKTLAGLLARTPHAAPAIVLQGQIAYDRQAYSRAETLFRQAIAIDHRNGSAFVMLGNVLRIQGDTDGAKDAYRQALRINPNDITAKKNLKRLY